MDRIEKFIQNSKSLQHYDYLIENFGKDEAFSWFITEVNKGENTGTQTLGSTQEVLKNNLIVTTNQRETIGLLHGLNYIYSLLEECDSLCIIDEEIIIKLHSNIMNSKNLSKYRTTDIGAYGYEDNRTLYSSFEDISSQIESLVITQNRVALKKLSSYEMIREATLFFVKFITIHPFYDGNGRTARVLLSYMLRPLIPFPFTITTKRDNYIKGIEHSRVKRNKITRIMEFREPTELINIVIDDICSCWERFNNYIKERTINGLVRRGCLRFDNITKKAYNSLLKIGNYKYNYKNEIKLIKSGIVLKKEVIELENNTCCTIEY